MTAGTDLLHVGFDTWLESAPDAEAVRAGTVVWTYADVDRLAEDVRRRARLGVGERVAVAMNHADPAVVPAILAVLRSGAAYVPIDPSWPAARIGALVAQAGCRVVLTCPDHLALVEASAPGAETIVVTGDTAEPVPVLPRPAVDPAWPAYVIFTSGTTGRPKGVVVPHRAAAARLRWQQRTFPVDPGTPVLMTFSPSFDGSVWQILGALSHGGRCVTMPRRSHGDPRALLDLLLNNDIPVLKTVPPMLDLLLSTPGVEKLRSSLRGIGCGGEELPAALYRRCAETLPDTELVNIYGPTESTICALHWSGTLGDEPTPLGGPVDDAAVTVLDQLAEGVAPDEIGELCVGGGALAIGYLDDPRATATRFLPDPDGAPGGRRYSTGDLGSWSGGEFRFSGRRDRQVQVRGYRVELDEVERAMKAVLGTAHVVVTKVDDQLHAIVRRGERQPAWADVRRTLAETLPSYAVPSGWSLVDEVPAQASGKADLAAVAEVESGTVQRIRAIWARLLHHDEFDLDADFFLVGGHSLLAVRLLAALNTEFHRELDLFELFEHSTVRGQSALIGDRAPVAEDDDPEFAPAQRRRVRR